MPGGKFMKLRFPRSKVFGLCFIVLRLGNRLV